MDLTQVLVGVIFLGTIFLVITGWIDSVLAALLGIVLMILLGVMSGVQTFQTVDWNVIVILLSIWIISGYFGKSGVPDYLAAKVRARIAVEPTFPISALDVRPKEEGLIEYGIIVRGVVYDKRAMGPIREAAEKTCGEVPVEFELQYRWHPRLGEWHFR